MTEHWRLSAAVLLTGLLVSQALLRWSPLWLEEPRRLMEEQRRSSIVWRHAVQRLQRHSHDDHGAATLPAALADTRIAIREVIDALETRDDQRMGSAMLEEMPLADTPEPLASHFRVLRLRLQLDVRHAQVLLDTLAALRGALDSRPSRWSHCRIERQSSALPLQARCTLDIVLDDAFSRHRS